METHFLNLKNLNWLLSDCYEAERRYFNAAEDIQQTELKRFLDHESVNRNRFATKIAEQLSQAGIEPYKFTNAKGNLHRNGMEVKIALTTNNWKSLLEACQKQDERCLKRYSQLIKAGNLPREVLEMLQKQRTTVLNALDQLTLFKRRLPMPLPKHDPKVIPLKAI